MCQCVQSMCQCAMCCVFVVCWTHCVSVLSLFVLSVCMCVVSVCLSVCVCVCVSLFMLLCEWCLCVMKKFNEGDETWIIKYENGNEESGQIEFYSNAWLIMITKQLEEKKGKCSSFTKTIHFMQAMCKY